MDSRDSSSVTAPNRDTSSSPPEEDGSLSVTAALAKDAALLYQSGKFADCLKVLNQLLQKKEGDPKVLHNIAIVDNFHDVCSNPKKLLEVLNNVKKRSEELVHASGEHVDAVSDSGSNTVIGTNGNNSIAPQSSVANSLPIVLNGEFATYAVLFNIAVTWFHLHEYSNSFSILEPLYQNIAPINEEIALRICLLLLDVALLSHQAPRSADVINYVEKISCVSTLICQGDNGSSTQQQSSNLVTKSSGPNNIPIPDVSSSDPAANASESPLSRSLSEEAEYENFFTTLDISGQNLPRPSVVDSSNNFPRTQVDDSFPSIDLRLKLHLYKVRFLLLTRNPKAAKCEVKMAMNIARGKDYSMALFLKSQLEYARGNHHKAIKLLMASSNRTEIGTSVMYYNNLGCIYYRLGKYQTSTVFFSKALSSSSSIRKEKPLTLSTFSQDKSLLIVYNCGVQYLACGKPVLAARCFHKSSLVFYNWPLLWLRIAECCLMALEKGLLESGGGPSIRSEVRVHVVGQGKWRNLLMEDGVSRNGQMDFVGREDSFLGDDRLPKLSMPLARQCLLNALHLLNSPETFLKSGLPSNAQEEETVSPNNTNYKSVSITASRADRFESGGDSQAHNLGVDAGQVSANGELKEQKSGNNLNATWQSSISDYEEICRKENQMITESVLADLAYVELELGNPLKALSTARTLLKVAKCSRIYIFLGNVYAAEALCLLNRSKEAAEHLLIYLSNENNIELPYTLEDCKKWQVEKTVDVEESNVGSVDFKSLLPRLQYYQDGTCVVHHLFGHEVVEKINDMYCDAFLTAHFEVPGEMFSLAMEAKRRGMGVVGSTQNILDFIKQRVQEALDRNVNDHLQFILGTESGMVTAIVALVRKLLGSVKSSSREAKVSVEIVFPVSSDSVTRTTSSSSLGLSLSEVGDFMKVPVIPGVASGEGCSINGGCASCPYMKMNSLTSLLKVCESLPNEKDYLSAYKAERFSSRTPNGKLIADVGCEPILHMRHFQATKRLPEKLVSQILHPLSNGRPVSFT